VTLSSADDCNSRNTIGCGTALARNMTPPKRGIRRRDNLRAEQR
jgi:hypothetical protein